GDAVHHAAPGAPARGARVLEERQVRARAALLVGVEEVVDGRVVLVDALLDEPQSEDARVEVDVGRRVAGDRRDVVDALQLHGRHTVSYPDIAHHRDVAAVLARGLGARLAPFLAALREDQPPGTQ